MVEQNLQVRFIPAGLFIEEFKEDGCIISKGKKVGRIFTLDVDVLEIESAMFAHGAGVVADIEI